jgi:hypothetical protein
MGDVRYDERHLCLDSLLDTCRRNRWAISLSEVVMYALDGGRTVRRWQMRSRQWPSSLPLHSRRRACRGAQCRPSSGSCRRRHLCLGFRVNGALKGYQDRWPSRRIPYSIACWAWKLPKYQRNVLFSLVDSTHDPCRPVKPWNSTLVSPLMRRFLIVSEYGDELDEYGCRDTDLRSAALNGRRTACIVTV